jgi:hypothetical protein
MLSMGKKLELWEKELPQDKLALLAYLAKKTRDEEVTKEVDKQMADINKGLTTAVAGALIELYDFSSIEIEEVVKKTNEFLKEKEEFLEKWGSDFMTKIKELEPKIKDEIIRLTKDKEPQTINRLEIVKKVQKKFNIPLDNANEIFLMVKETKFPQLNDSKHTPKKFINKHVDKETLEDIKKDIKNKADTEEKEVRQVIIPKKEEKGSSEAIDKQKKEVINMFEVVEKKIKFKGKYHDYEKDKTGLKVGSEFFKNLDEFEAFRIREIEEFEKMTEEIRQAFVYEG